MSTPFEDVVWESGIDQGVFHARVVRTADYTGRLEVKHVASGATLLDKEVGLSYRAIFGPDIADLNEWQGDAINAVDKYIEEQK